MCDWFIQHSKGKKILLCSTDTTEPVTKRPRGRPRKVRQLDDVYIDTDINEDVIERHTPVEYDTTGLQDTTINEDYDKVIIRDMGDDDNLDSTYDFTSNGVKTEEGIDDVKDTDYSPASHPSSSRRRVQPRRSMKGTNRQLMKDYIISKVKMEPSDVSSVDEQSVEEVASDPQLPSNIGNEKRRRGRPRKVIRVNEIAGNRKEPIDLNLTMAENGGENGDENKLVDATNLDSTEAGRKDALEVTAAGEIGGNFGETGKKNLENQTIERTGACTDETLPEEDINKDKHSSENVTISHYQLPSNIGNEKRKRGRPRKVIQVKETAGNHEEPIDLNLTMAGNGYRNGDENNLDDAANLDSTEAGLNDVPEITADSEINGNTDENGKENLENQSVKTTGGCTDETLHEEDSDKDVNSSENLTNTFDTSTPDADENKTNDEVSTIDNDEMVITGTVEGIDLNNESYSNGESEKNSLNNESDEAKSTNDDVIMTSEKSTEANFDNTETSSSNENEIGDLIIEFNEENLMYSCTLCFSKFEDEINANKHAATHDPVLQSDILNDTELESQTSGSNLTTNKGPKKLAQKRKKSDKPKGDKSQEGPFACDICHQEFRTAQYLYRHMVMHTDMFSCKVCLKTFSRKDSMQKHVLKCCPDEAEKMKILHCDLCLRVFSTVSGKKKHMKRCTLVQCSICGFRFNSKEDLDEHNCRGGRPEDSSVGRYSCGKCPKSFQSLHYLKQHSLIHKELHACSHCGKCLPSQEELESHSLTCQTIGAIKLLGQGQCERCGQIFNTLKTFREHALSHTHPYQCNHCLRRFVKIGTLTSHDCSNNPQSFSCQTCSRLFKNQVSLDKHIKSHGCMRYQCSACEKQFRMKSEARDHKCEAENQEERTILYTSETTEVCAKCGKSFSTRSNLLKHMTLHGEKNFPCPHCMKRFHLDVYLKEHIASVHYRIYKYQCQDCGKMLKSKTGFNMHVSLFHSPVVESFPCTECPKIFKSKGNLKAHMYRHSSDRKFKCYVCNRAFKYPDQLSRHKVEHKIVEKLSCMYCEKQFCRRYELKRHLQIYHSGYVYVCGVCSSRCGHRHTLVRHYKRKHPEDYHLLSQDGYLNSLMKHVSELTNLKQEAVTDRVRRVPTLLKHSKANKLLSERAVKVPETAVKQLQSMSVETCTLKRYQLYRDGGVVKVNEGSAQQLSVTGDGAVILAQDGNIFQPQALMAEDQLLPPAEGTISGPSDNEQIDLIQTTDGTININSIQGLPQTLETLDSSEGQIVILQIVETSDHLNTDITPGEIIQQIKVESNEAVNIQQGDLQEISNLQQIQAATSDEVQIVNYPEDLNIVDVSAVKEVGGGLLHIQNVTNEQNIETADGEGATDDLQVVQEGISGHDAETL